MSSHRTLTADVREAYDSSAGAWGAGPAQRIYGRLADALVAHAPDGLEGMTILDVGAGTGAVTRSLIAAGARPVALDVSAAMLGQDRRARPPSAAGDATALPVASASVDGLAAGFSFNHLLDPVKGLSEARRVVRQGGIVLVSTFASQPAHPAKQIADAVACRYGFEPPPWHHTLKTATEPLMARADRVGALAESAGLRDVDAVETRIDVGLDDPEALAAWRLGMASLAPFVASLPAATRRALRADVITGIGDSFEPYLPRVVLCSARVTR